MKSAELAAIAGVTVRTLRHYHQLGLLPEPARLANGYRIYTTDHLVRLLCVRQLAAAGIPLNDISPMLSAHPSDLTPLLERLRAQIDEQIHLLLEQRTRLIELASHPGPLGLPAELRDLYSEARGNTPQTQQDTGYKVLTLLKWALSPQTYQQIVMLLQFATSPDFREQVREAGRRFEELDDTSSPHAIEELVDLSRPLVTLYLSRSPSHAKERVLDSPAGRLLTGLLESQLNSVQRLYLSRVCSVANEAEKGGEQLEAKC